VTRIEHDSQWRYVIGEPVTDPAILAAHAAGWPRTKCSSGTPPA
jgi:hypothetical protein